MHNTHTTRWDWGRTTKSKLHGFTWNPKMSHHPDSYHFQTSTAETESGRILLVANGFRTTLNSNSIESVWTDGNYVFFKLWFSTWWQCPHDLTVHSVLSGFAHVGQMWSLVGGAVTIRETKNVRNKQDVNQKWGKSRRTSMLNLKHFNLLPKLKKKSHLKLLSNTDCLCVSHIYTITYDGIFSHYI